MTINLHPSDEKALKKLIDARPVWHSNRLAKEALDLDPETILHAGPPFNTVHDIPQPILNSARCALVFEGMASDFAESNELIFNEEINFQPAQDRQTVIPLAGVVSSSMWLHEIVDAANPANPKAYTPFNGGNGPAMRLGLCSNAVVEHFRWLNSELAEVLDDCKLDDLSLIPIAKSALIQGDDCHGRTIAGTNILIQHLQPTLDKHPMANQFLIDGPSFFLNLWMAACKCMLLNSSKIDESSVVVAAAGNGLNTGIKFSCSPDEWITVPAMPPAGDIGSFDKQRALSAIGDSAVVDLVGFGAMAFSYAPAQQAIFKKFLPEDAYELPKNILAYEHPEFGELRTRVGVSARQVLAQSTTPIVSLGIIDKLGKEGRLGGGIYRYPLELFSSF